MSFTAGMAAVSWSKNIYFGSSRFVSLRENNIFYVGLSCFSCIMFYMVVELNLQLEIWQNNFFCHWFLVFCFYVFVFGFLVSCSFFFFCYFFLVICFHSFFCFVILVCFFLFCFFLFCFCFLSVFMVRRGLEEGGKLELPL